MIKTIGIIGQGFVGTAIREKFRNFFEVLAYDKKWTFTKKFDNRGAYRTTYNGNIKDLCNFTDVIFVCVPTPMYEDGECDISIVKIVLQEISDYNFTGDVIIKSTIPPGTTEKFNKIFKKLKISFSPEFLTEANANDDFDKQNRIIIGSDNKTENIVEMFKKVFPKAKIITIPSKEGEMVKYTTNCFLATKVSFFNDIYSFCNNKEIDYNTVIKSVLLDNRIGKSHTMVPGPDGDFGYGGHCFPKDMNALLYESKGNTPMPTIEGAEKTNKFVRSHKDWEKMENRAISKKRENINI
jgi:UDPglucose 6-dehydrogenase